MLRLQGKEEINLDPRNAERELKKHYSKQSSFQFTFNLTDLCRTPIDGEERVCIVGPRTDARDLR